MAIEVFIVCVSVLQPIRYSNSGAVCGTGIPACPLVNQCHYFAGQTEKSVLPEILFAGRPRYDSMPKLVLHSSQLKLFFREDSPNMAQKPWLNGLGMIIVWMMLYPTMIAAQQPALSLIPVPANVQAGSGSLRVDSSFTVALAGHFEPRFDRA